MRSLSANYKFGLLAVFVLGALLPLRSFAGTCQVSIQSNDSLAEISVDDGPRSHLGSKRPKFIACAQQRQRVTVISGDQQLFTRTIPSVEDVRLGKFGSAKWNVNFRQRETSPLRIEDPKRVVVESMDQSKVLEELAQLRGMVQTLLAQNQAPAKAVADEPTPSLRMPSSTSDSHLTAVQSSNGLSDVFSANPGLFVQLYSIPTLRSGHLVLTQKDRELVKRELQDGRAKILACRWRKNVNLTRVLVGPLSGQSHADQFSRDLGRDTFVVHDPGCAIETRVVGN